MQRGVLAVLCASLVLLSVPASVVGAAGGTATTGVVPTAATQERSAGSTDAASNVASALREGNDTTTVVVRLEEATLPTRQAREHASDRAKQALERHARRTQATVVRFARGTDGVAVRERFWITNAVVLSVDRSRVDLDAIAALDGVRRLHPNFEMRAPQPSPSSDRPAATAGNGTGYDTTYGLSQINATAVWDAYGTRGGGVKVAVLDTGVDPDHPDIDLYTRDASNETHPGGWAEFDENGDRVPGSVPHDTAEHGTHTSGTVAGGDASGEYIGVAPDAELMHGLVLPDGEGTFAQIVAGMEWATANDADVISMSLGADGHYETMIAPVRNAQAAGVVVVGSSGNTGAGTSGTPGNVYESVAVGASDSTLGIAAFSSGETVDTSADWGSDAPAAWPSSYVVPDVAAPGVAVKSATPGGGYQRLSGTSMAAPHAAGAVALLLAAGGGDASVGEVKTALYRKAFKPGDCDPDCSPRDGNDTRYGAGIVDVKAAADLVAADAGVEGTVTDANGTPVSGATVELDTGLSTTTDADGDYRLRAVPGEYAVSAVGPFGYADASETVNVTNGSFAAADFTLAATVDAHVTDDQPSGVHAGDAASTTVRVANVRNYTVELAGDYSAADATLVVDGVERSFGEPIPFDDHSGTVTVTVETSRNATGTFSLRHTLAGPRGPVSLTTGPTTAYADEVRVGVVDSATGSQYGTDVAATLESRLPVNYRVTVVNGTDAAVAAVDEYDVFAVQNFTSDRESVSSFVDATEGGDVGVVYLNQYGPVSNAVSKLSAVTGNPRVTRQQARFYNYNDVYYDVSTNHSIVDGVGAPGDHVVLQGIGYFDWFEQYDGSQRLARAGYVSCGFFGCSEVTVEESSALAVDGMSRTVLASSLGRVPPVRNDEYTAAADDALANAVAWASDDPPATVTDGQPRTARPGEAVEVTLDATNLTKATVSVDDEFSTLAADEVTLSVNGERRSLGTPISFDGRSGDVTVRLEPEPNATGSVSLDYALVADGEMVTGSTGPTTVYEPPLTVPGDAATIQEAVNVAPPGTTIVVGDGEYGPVNVRNAGNYGLTIRGAPGADATVTAPEGRNDRQPAVRIAADDVTVENLDVDVPTEWDNGVSIEDAENVSVVDVTVTGGEKGVAVGSGASDSPDATVRNVTVTGAKTGVLVYHSAGSTVANSTVRDAIDAGVKLWFANRTTVRDNRVSGSPVGVTFRAWNYGATVADNTIARTDTGIHIEALSTGKRVVGNDVSANRTGVVVDGSTAGWSAETRLLRNRVDAPTGVAVTTDPGAVHVRYNHLRATDVAVSYEGREPLDARLNYFGDRGPVDTSVPDTVAYDPFLTAPPDAVETGNATRIATDLELSAGETYALGVPGPTNQSIRDVLGSSFAGDVSRYNPTADRWEPVTGDGRLADVDALDAFRVVPENDTRAVVAFRSDGAPPAAGTGSHPKARTPGEAPLVPGWNFVAAPAYASVEDAFDDASANVTRVRPAFAQPDSQLGPRGDLDDVYRLGNASASPNASAFAGYFVYATERGTLPANLSADPTPATLYANLSIRTDLAMDDAAPTGDAASTVERNVTVGDATRTRVVVHGDAYATVLRPADDAGNETASRQAVTGPLATG